ncbi:cobalamin biosynthesis protein [Sulfurisphaera javensis]|uniref:Probable cobalamin biosynthesis protein CobD n=1 Tax=Sulfurisphaera javensis TaxID=2049879 RepID=A0AAT9GQ28_9CREN
MLPILYLAILLDLLIGEPPLFIHPVVWTGKISEKLIKPYRGYAYGIFIWITSVIPVLIFLLFPLYIPNKLIQIILLVLFLKTTFSIRLLYSLVRKSIPINLENRKYAQQLVRRNVYIIDDPHVASAVIESLFESLVDGITSPIFWFLILGYPGALLQRLANTMDSMVGYKTPELIKEGWFSAKVDTILNYIPARLTAILMLISAYLLGFKPRNTIETLKKSNIESINARYPISFASAILNVKLEKIGYYSVGGGNLPNENDVKIALKIFKVTLILFILMISIIYYYLYGLSFLSYPYGLIKFL